LLSLAYCTSDATVRLPDSPPQVKKSASGLSLLSLEADGSEDWETGDHNIEIPQDIDTYVEKALGISPTSVTDELSFGPATHTGRY